VLLKVGPWKLDREPPITYCSTHASLTQALDKAHAAYERVRESLDFTLASFAYEHYRRAVAQLAEHLESCSECRGKKEVIEASCFSLQVSSPDQCHPLEKRLRATTLLKTSQSGIHEAAITIDAMRRLHLEHIAFNQIGAVSDRHLSQRSICSSGIVRTRVNSVSRHCPPSLIARARKFPRRICPRTGSALPL